MKITRKIIAFLFITSLVYLCISFVLILLPTPTKQDIENYDFSSLGDITQQSSAGEERWLNLRDKSNLFYRYYESNSESTLILIHGSSGESRYLGEVATFIANNGLANVITPDLRGHGRSSEHKGDIGYIGQYDHDIEDIVDFIRQQRPDSKIVLGGHSSGGGLALRYAGNNAVSRVDGYLLLAPFLGHKAPTVKADSGGWVTVALARIIGLTMLNNLGVKAFNYLPVLIFNRPDTSIDGLQTPDYSYRLTVSFAPNDYTNDIKNIHYPTLVLVGDKDEGFYADKFHEVFKQAGGWADVKIISKAKHLDIVNNQQALLEISNWYKSRFYNN